MQKLATEYWADNNLNSKNGTFCRMEWIKAQCKEYFLHGGREKYDKREEDINAKLILERSNRENGEADQKLTHEISQRFCDRKISVLDVGSCYNPLSVDDALDVTAIDLTPAEGVLRCDFLNVAIGKENILSPDSQEIHQLSAKSFDAVVFSLLLEYLPCPKQRYTCCRKAYDLLKSGGTLIIVSPDSKHVGANAMLMRSWRYALSKLGFMRIKYEKLRHIHCMAFRRCRCREVAMRWADLQRFPEDERRYISETDIFIPQDFQSMRSDQEKQGDLDKYDESDLIDVFFELPFGNETVSDLCED